MSALFRTATLVLLSVGCTTTSHQTVETKAASQSRTDPSIAALADELVRGAELRANAATMRVYVHPLQAAPGDERAIDSNVLEHVTKELVHSLSTELNVLDIGLSDDTLRENDDVREIAVAIDATHVLLGDLALDDQGFVLTTRLVDAHSLLIVAIARHIVERPSLTVRRRPPQRGEFASSAVIAQPTTSSRSKPAPVEQASAPPVIAAREEPLRAPPKAEPEPRVAKAIPEPEPKLEPKLEPELEPDPSPINDDPLVTALLQGRYRAPQAELEALRALEAEQGPTATGGPAATRTEEQ